MRRLVILLVAVLAIALVLPASAQPRRYTIAFVPGVAGDAFYITMERGVRLAAERLGVDVIVQFPADFDAVLQTPIVDALIARGIDALVTAPTGRESMIAPLRRALDAGAVVLTVDTFIEDGVYQDGQGDGDFPITYIGSDNVLGGVFAADALAEAIGLAGKVYIQNTEPGVSTVDQREEGFRQGIAKYPNIEIVGRDFNGDDANVAAEQTAATLQRVPDLAGIFGTNLFSARGAGNAVQAAGLSGIVRVVHFDAPVSAIEGLRQGLFDLVIAQKPFDMGYLGVEMVVAFLDGVASIPARIPTGYALITRDNVDDPNVARFIYTD